jgi:O-antigen/teichoic acid export membrane protein
MGSGHPLRGLQRVRFLTYPGAVRSPGSSAEQSPKVLRSGSCDDLTSDESLELNEGRRRRSWLVYLAASGSLVQRFVALGTSLVATAVATRHLEGPELTIWFVVMSLVVLQSVADLGMMAQLTTAVASTSGRSRGQDIQGLLSNAIRSATVVGIGLFGTAFVALAISGADEAWLVFVAMSACTVPLQGSVRVLHGLQRGGAVSLASALAYLIMLVGLIGVLVNGEVPLTALVAISTSPPLVTGVLCLLVLHRTTEFRVWLPPRGGGYFRATVVASTPYLTIAVASLIAFSSDSMVLSVTTNDSDVAQYSLAYRLFTQAPILIYFLTSALWPAVADAGANADEAWSASAVRRSFIVSVSTVGAASFLLLFVGNRLISLWAGSEFQASTSLLWWAAAYSVVHAMWSPLHFAMMGCNRTAFVAKTMVLMATLNIVLSIPLAAKFGAPGPIVGSVVSLFFLVVVPYLRVFQLTGFRNEYSPSANSAEQ